MLLRTEKNQLPKRIRIQSIYSLHIINDAVPLFLKLYILSRAVYERNIGTNIQINFAFKLFYVINIENKRTYSKNLIQDFFFVFISLFVRGTDSFWKQTLDYTITPMYACVFFILLGLGACFLSIFVLSNSFKIVYYIINTQIKEEKLVT